MRAERMMLRAKHLAARKGLESLLRKAMDENNELRKTVAELSNQLQKHEDDGKLIRPATMSETSKILLSQSGATNEPAKDVLVTK